MGRRNNRAARCVGCRMLPELCFCADIPRLALQTRLVIVMHKCEQTKTTNTGWLAARAMGGLVHVRGDLLTPAPTLDPSTWHNAAVLFPSEHASELRQRAEVGTLVVVDGTWSQARRIVRREPALVGLRHVKLPPLPRSRYTLRNTGRLDGQATLEAIAHAVSVLEGEAAAAPLMNLFTLMVARTLRSRGSA